ncbi:MAG: Lrp/AsnC family leucine-responsive transcriptional regulator [Crocinitomicaceae bacterium]|jgi:Lrp/AsnC family leucine-responsive transcriptional regulator
MEIKLDELDKTILVLLTDNAKLSNKEIANKIGLTITPTYERVRRLERLGIIKGYRAMLDRKLMGKELQVHCHVSLKDHSTTLIQQFESKVIQLDQVSACYNIAGDYDYTLYVEVEDMDAYHNFLRSTLASIQNISNVQSAFVMKTMKE